MSTRRMKAVIIIVGLGTWIGGVMSVDSQIKVNDANALGSGASFSPKDSFPEPTYKPDEIIVKFKRPVADTLEEQLAEGKAVGALELPDSLDNINSKYKVENIKPVIKNFRAKRQRIKGLLERDEALLTERERHLLRRLKRVP